MLSTASTGLSVLAEIIDPKILRCQLMNNKEVKSVKANCYIDDYEKIKKLSKLASFKEDKAIAIPEIIRRLLLEWEAKHGNEEWPTDISQEERN